MTREEVKAILGETATEEAISSYLNAIHRANELDKKSKEDAVKLAELLRKEELQRQAELTKEEQLLEREKAIAAKEREASILVNETKAKQVLINAGMSVEDIDVDLLSALVSENEETTLLRAQKMAALHSKTVENVTKATTNKLLNVDTKPQMGNTDPNDDVMTKEKFDKLSYSQALELSVSDPETFKKFSGI